MLLLHCTDSTIILSLLVDVAELSRVMPVITFGYSDPGRAATAGGQEKLVAESDGRLNGPGSGDSSIQKLNCDGN